MDDKLTRKSQDALSSAVRRAAADGNPQVDPLHLLVTVEVMVPKNVSNKGRQALEDLREATAGEDPREALLQRAKSA